MPHRVVVPRVATLPAAAAGLTYTMILGTASAVANSHVEFLSAGAAGTMKGKLNSSNGEAAIEVSTNGVNLANAVRARMVGNLAIVGDWITVTCYDGTNWVASGQSGATDGNVFVI